MTVPATSGTATPPPPPPFNPDKQAGDLISRNQQEECSVRLPIVGGLGCHQDTNGAAVGSYLAGMAASDPAQARAVFDKAMDKTPEASERREVARGLVNSMTPDQLRQLASTPDGRAMLERARNELRANNEGANKTYATRVDTAFKAADLQKEPGFQKMDAASQQRVLGDIGRQQDNPKAVDNLVALAKTPGFQAAPAGTRTALLGALAQHPTDAAFRDGLGKLAGDPAFQKLNPAQQAESITAFDKVAKSEVYKGKEGSWFFGIGGKEVSAADQKKVLDNARQVVTSPGFHDLGASSRQALMNAFGKHATDAAFTGRLTKFASDPGFMAVNDPARETRLLNRYAGDKNFAQGMDTLLGDAKYKALPAADRAKVLGDMDKLAGTASYKDAKPADRQAMVEIMGNISAQSAAHPGNTAQRNTLNQILDGHIKLGLYQRPPIVSGGQTFYNYGKANSDGIFLNTDPAVRAQAVSSNHYVDTLAHEVNHKLNGTTTAGTADRFLDEYRAAVVGKETALGRSLTPAEQKRAMDNLVDGTNPDYAHLANLYNTDAKFKAAVDDMYKTVNGSTDPATGTVTPPATVSPEDARAQLLAQGNSSTYLNKAGNLDNH